MARTPLEPGHRAPDFDLTSTEDVVLMLRDEVPRAAQVLYFFGDPEDERARRDLSALAGRFSALMELPAAVLGVSPAQLEPLKALQRELRLPFPLLTDDRGFSRAYGVEPPGEEGSGGETVLVVVDRRQKVIYLEHDPQSVEAELDGVELQLKKLPSPTDNYPRRVTNRLVDGWVNRMLGVRKRRA